MAFRGLNGDKLFLNQHYEVVPARGLQTHKGWEPFPKVTNIYKKLKHQQPR